MLGEPESEPTPKEQRYTQQRLSRRRNPPRSEPLPFRKETLLGQQRTLEKEKRQNEIEQRQAKMR